ncbi:uncharacterized protein LOC142330368 [Lycorma delicatula]|uniref:uncharacterized protein LOC142330368 n=1 Tax=Lycorma delicatula TaxID=130591 RepID=UPI003F511BD0
MTSPVRIRRSTLKNKFHRSNNHRQSNGNINNNNNSNNNGRIPNLPMLPSSPSSYVITGRRNDNSYLSSVLLTTPGISSAAVSAVAAAVSTATVSSISSTTISSSKNKTMSNDNNRRNSKNNNSNNNNNNNTALADVICDEEWCSTSRVSVLPVELNINKVLTPDNITTPSSSATYATAVPATANTTGVRNNEVNMT